MDSHEVGIKISTIRKEKGWTQKDIAEKLHVSTAAVSKWERGLNYPDLALMEPLAELLGITVAELLGLVNEPEDKIIKNITEISKGEKDRLAHDIRKRIGLLLGIIVVFFVVIVFILVVGRNKESSEMITNLSSSGFLEIIPLVLGFLSWGLALAGALLGREKLKERWKVYSVISLICCSIALYFPILGIDFRIRIGDFSSAEDTVWALNYSSVVLLIGTLLFNSLSWKLNKK